MTPRKRYIRWQLIVYDLLLFLAIVIFMLVIYKERTPLNNIEACQQAAVAFICIFGMRLICNVYGQIWRYGGIQCYMKLMIADAIAFCIDYPTEILLPVKTISFARLLSIACINLLGALAMRMIYRYAYKCGTETSPKGRLLMFLLRVFAGRKIVGEREEKHQKIKIAIIGAGRIGVSLAEELIGNPMAAYVPSCFIDVKKEKVGRQIHDIPVFLEDEGTLEHLRDLEIQEVVFAITNLGEQQKKNMYNYYKNAGYKVKVYDFPTIHTAGGKRHLREFDIEELLFRQPILVNDEKTYAYYRGKVVLITGGGGSIGSELCRQIAKMEPKRLIILDVYENGAYDVQQELQIAYHEKLDLHVEIVSICNRVGLERVFEEYRPEIVIHAAAHKHVPLMEKNCVEAVENNVFGTLNAVEMSVKYGVERFIMVSTDKAVNPTNIMGATKRVCEMIVQAHSQDGGKTTFSATRFGNVLGSAGSVIPLFKRQIAAGGPVTITDERIIRYFMTIPEASQLVLQSGAMAKNGELFVLDMGHPVKILDLAMNMIKLAGFTPHKDIEIIETGLRPGEKLYEELLVKTEELEKTDNSLIFIERDAAIGMSVLEQKLGILRDAVATNDDEMVRKAMKRVVPTYHTPEEVNRNAEQAKEMREQAEA